MPAKGYVNFFVFAFLRRLFFIGGFMKNEKLKILVECAVMVALSTVLSFITIYHAPLGGSVTLCSMAPLILISCMHGVGPGLASAFVHSSLQLLFGLANFSYIPDAKGMLLCALFDYILPFTVIGLAGIFVHDRNKKPGIIAVLGGTFVVMLIKYACHVVAGAVVWYSITKEGQWNDVVNNLGMWSYSLFYNAWFSIPETVITLVSTPAVISAVWTIRKPQEQENK